MMMRALKQGLAKHYIPISSVNPRRLSARKRQFQTAAWRHSSLQVSEQKLQDDVIILLLYQMDVLYNRKEGSYNSIVSV
jgi:hypothetical protein